MEDFRKKKPKQRVVRGSATGPSPMDQIIQVMTQLKLIISLAQMADPPLPLMMIKMKVTMS